MNKTLSEMTLKELWELFPIILSEHKNCWNDWYREEEERILAFLKRKDIRLSHIGSTAIRNIQAKPIVDILLEIPKIPEYPGFLERSESLDCGIQGSSMESVKKILIENGYVCMSERRDRKSFNRGYTDEGFAEKVFHLHLRYYGDNDELYFRDFMNETPSLAKEYEELKLSLWKKYEHNRDAYTDAKASFVTKYTECAKREYKNRYQAVT